jgi:hypothetical protein
MVVGHMRGVFQADVFLRLSPASGSVQVLEFPNRPECLRVDVLTPTPLPDGRLGFLQGCSQFSEFRMLGMDVETAEAFPIMGQRLPFPSRSFAWDPGLNRGLASNGDDICGSIAWLTRQGPELLPVTIRDGTRSWGLDEYFRSPPGGGCSDQGIADWPTWSPDGKEIAFFASPQSIGLDGFARLDAPFNVYVMDPDELKPRSVLEDVVHPRSLTWSPNSRWLAFSGKVGGKAGTWLFAPATRSFRQVTDFELPLVAWSPDGSKLAGLYNSDITMWPPETDILIFDVSELT